MEYKDKFIGFIDILGFEYLVNHSVSEGGMAPAEIYQVLQSFGSMEDVRGQFEKYGPMICPQSRYERRDLDFCLTTSSDHMIVSTEVSPAGVINLVQHCSAVVIKLLKFGVMCRGFIAKGPIWHSKETQFGPGLNHAVKGEKGVTAFRRTADEKGTPFVEVDPTVCEFVAGCGDSCVKEIFSRCVSTDSQVTALYPIKRFSHSFLIGGYGIKFDPEKEKKFNHAVREWLEDFKRKIGKFVDRTNPSAVAKFEQYIKALDEQLKNCDETDKFIDMLMEPYPRIH